MVRPGIRFMVLSAFAFSAMTVCVKVAAVRLPTVEIVFVRALISLALSLVGLAGSGVSLLGKRRGLLLLRGLLGFGGLHCVFWSVAHLPLAEATVLQYTHPLFTALLATVLLSESPGPGVLRGIALSLAGLALVTGLVGGASQGLMLEPSAVAVALAGAFLSACAYVVVRRLSATESPLVIVLYFPLVTVPATLPLVWHTAVWPVGAEWLWLLGVGVWAQVGQVALTHGLRRERAARATALSYLQVLFAAGFGLLLFGERLTPWAACGAALIVLGSLVAGRRGETLAPATLASGGAGAGSGAAELAGRDRIPPRY